MSRSGAVSSLNNASQKSLRFQLLFRSLAVLAGLFLLVGYLQYILMKDFTYHNKAQSVRDQIMAVSRELMSQAGVYVNREPGDAKPERVRRLLLPPDVSIAYIDPYDGFTVLSEGGGQAIPHLSDQAYEEARAVGKGKMPRHSVVKAEDGTEQLVLLEPTGPRGGTGTSGLLQISTSTAPLKDLLLRQVFIYTALTALALIVGLLIYLPVIRRALIPLSNMVDTAERIDAGNLTERFPPHQGQREIDRLSQSFNGMLTRLELSFLAEQEAKEQMRRFVADASHELRTPLTSIHGFLEVLLRGAAHRPEQLQSALTSMHGESKRINKLVEDLLLLAKLDRAPELRMQKGNLSGLVTEMQAQLSILAAGRQVILETDAGATGVFDPDKIKQVVLNLFHNAVQHTDAEKGRITVSVTRADDRLKLAVADNGPGLAEEQAAYVFERFYRSDTSRTRKYGGAGLGLSISKSIVEAHDGTIGVTSRAGEGAVFTFAIPAMPPLPSELQKVAKR